MGNVKILTRDRVQVGLTRHRYCLPQFFFLFYFGLRIEEWRQ